MVKVICYGRESLYSDREDAIMEFQINMFNSEGSEQARYVHVLNDLYAGKEVCTDGE